jgi:hypothetical protein
MGLERLVHAIPLAITATAYPRRRTSYSKLQWQQLHFAEAIFCIKLPTSSIEHHEIKMYGVGGIAPRPDRSTPAKWALCTHWQEPGWAPAALWPLLKNTHPLFLQETERIPLHCCCECGHETAAGLPSQRHVLYVCCEVRTLTSLIRRQAPWYSQPAFFQLNTCGHSHFATSSLRGLVCRLQLLLALASAVILRS